MEKSTNDDQFFVGMFLVHKEEVIFYGWKVGMKHESCIMEYIFKAFFVASGWPSNVFALKFCPPPSKGLH